MLYIGTDTCCNVVAKDGSVKKEEHEEAVQPVEKVVLIYIQIPSNEATTLTTLPCDP